MQLNNLVIIPIPATSTPLNTNLQFLPMSPFKSKTFINNINNDDISWKKSISAFKKFKGKRDKQTKNSNSNSNKYSSSQQLNSSRNHHHHYMLLDQLNVIENDNYQQRILSEKRFTLVNIDEVSNNNFYKISMVNKNHNCDNIKAEHKGEKMIPEQLQGIQLKEEFIQYNEDQQQQKKLDYYDPCNAPFFQFGINYRYLPKQNKVYKIESNNNSGSMIAEQQGYMISPMIKRSDSVKERKQYNKRQTTNTNNKTKSESYVNVSVIENGNNNNKMERQKQKLDHFNSSNVNYNETNQYNLVKKQQSNNSNNQSYNYNNCNIKKYDKMEQQFQRKRKPYCSQGLLPQYTQQHYNNSLQISSIYNNDDPFIIIKSTTQRRQFSSSNQSISTIKRADSYKYKQIKKSSYTNHNNTNNNNNNNPTLTTNRQQKPTTNTFHSRSLYSYNNNNNSQQQRQRLSQHNSIHHDSNDSNSSSNSSELGNNDFGNNQLQMIQFDLFNHINQQMRQIKQEMLEGLCLNNSNGNINSSNSNSNCLDNLAIFQLKDDVQKKKQLHMINRQYNNKQIIKQYQFNNNIQQRQQQQQQQQQQ